MTKLTYREPTLADAELICTMSHTQATDSADEYNAMATVDSVREHLLKHLDKYLCRIIEIDGQPIGMLICYEMYWVYEGVRALYLESLYIHKDHRRQGYATEVFDWLHHYAAQQNLPEIAWMGAITNDPAHAFYTQMGAQRSEKWRIYSIATRGTEHADAE